MISDLDKKRLCECWRNYLKEKNWFIQEIKNNNTGLYDTIEERIDAWIWSRAEEMNLNYDQNDQSIIECRNNFLSSLKQ